MARGNSIIVSANPRGVHSEGTASEAFKPGHLLQVDVSAGLDDNGRPYYELFTGATGTRCLPTVADIGFQGGTANTAYAAGDRVKVYHPLPGEELNVRVNTGVTTTFDMALILETATGVLLATTGSPESEPFACREVLTSAADDLCHVVATGV